ncbi:MAG: acetyl-CoA carboxylase biotin carboxyl carrier protein subunit [Ignavibacteriales bacterium]|nr:acetyl-CoA carboxylase biotin carboxyl carrier protein subunit [Ignavibacteriales bacterium]
MSKFTLHIDDKHFEVDEREEGLAIDGKLHDVNIHKLTENEYSILIEAKSFHLFFNNCRKCFCARIDNHVFEIKRQTLRDQLAERFLKTSSDHSHAVTFRAPMPGLVTKVIRQADQQVNEGDGILVVEAMKMENEIKTSKAGIIKKIFVREKQAVEKGDPLFIIE